MKLKFVLPLFVLFLLSDTKSVQSAVLPQEKTIVRPNIIVSATIGIPKMTLWGYGAPGAIVELSGIGVDQSVTSEANGYYSFDLVYLPNTSSFPELCVTAIDQEGKITPPTCIPPIASGNYFYNVGPVILPPTISIGAPQARPESQVSAQGQTIPGSTVEIKLARPEVGSGILGFRFVKRALAFYIPSFTVISDASGKYSFNMPTSDDTTWRVFAVTEYEDGNKSPKSNTLKFETLSPLAHIWQSLLEFLKTFLSWPRIIILELLIILILVATALVVIKKKKGKAS
ncbi:MAG: hypothetical protein M1426_03840 [Patescibacteria group bacterium]|nr:hypothetical protein [Patescibacteria group bacterium]